MIFQFSVIFINNSLSQTTWQWMNPSTTANHLFDIEYIDAVTGYACGNFGTILKTTNSGNNWQLLNTSVIFQNFDDRYYSKLKSISFINSLTGWIIGHKNILKTTNGGLSWNTLAKPFYYYEEEIKFFNAQTGYLVSQNFYKTTDGAASWVQIPAPFSNSLRFFHCQDLNNISIIANTASLAHIFKTTNSGASWIEQFADTALSFTINDIYYSNQNTGYIIGNKYPLNRFYFLKTTNGGSNWVVNKFNDSYRNLYSVIFSSENNGIITADSSRIYRTTNGGINWTNQVISGTPLTFYRASLKTPSTITLAGSCGNIMESSDFGFSWVSKDIHITNNNLNSIAFSGTQKGVIAGDKGTILKTTNGGNNWTAVNFTSAANLTKIYYFSNNVIYTGGSVPILYKSTNDGISWSNFDFSDKLSSITGIYFQNENTGLVSGMSIRGYPFLLAKLFKTLNGGQNWSVDSSDYPVTDAASMRHLLAFYSPPWSGVTHAYRSTNGGSSFSLLTSSPQGHPGTHYASFFDTSFAFLSFSVDYYLRTTNFFASYENLTGSLLSIPPVPITKFSNYNHGYMSNIGIFSTTNSGYNWIYRSNLYYYLNDIIYLDSTIFIAITSDGGIIKCTGYGINSIKIVSNHIPSDFRIFQNYPNPFNPVTKIRFNLPLSSNEGMQLAKIIIYDILGREITKLVNDELNPGSYEVEWDASSYPSGVYFYRLVVGDASASLLKAGSSGFTETKKMILIK